MVGMLEYVGWGSSWESDRAGEREGTGKEGHRDKTVMPRSWVEGEESVGEERMQRDKRQVCLMSQRTLPHLRVQGHNVCGEVKVWGILGSGKREE